MAELSMPAYVIAWTAEDGTLSASCSQIPGWTVAAGTKRELTVLIAEFLREHSGGSYIYTWRNERTGHGGGPPDVASVDEGPSGAQEDV